MREVFLRTHGSTLLYVSCVMAVVKGAGSCCQFFFCVFFWGEGFTGFGIISRSLRSLFVLWMLSVLPWVSRASAFGQVVKPITPCQGEDDSKAEKKKKKKKPKESE